MLIKSKKWKNILIATIVLFALVVYTDILPALTDNASILWQTISANNEVKDIKLLEREYSELVLESKELMNKLNNRNASATGMQSLSHIITKLDLIAHESAVNITLIKPGAITKKESIVTQRIELGISGKYKNLYNCIKNIEDAKELVVLKEMSVKPKEALNDSLLIKAQLEVYLN